SNAWWWDVLKHGRGSKYARYFDIDWERGHGKVLLPVLGARLPDVLASDQVALAREGDDWLITYYDQPFPIAPNSLRSDFDIRANLSRSDWLALLDAQHYRLAYWRVGAHEINYRRFFDVNELVALRMEDPEVFAAANESLFRFVELGTVTGVRVDHPDGLRDPRDYFERLQRKFREVRGESDAFYIVGEKILSGSELLPRDWPIAGTSGYDFLIQLNSLFIARRNEHVMTDLHREFTGCTDAFDEIAYHSKKRVLALSFVSEVDGLAKCLSDLAEISSAGRDLTTRDLCAAIVETIACFDVYRTYVTEDSRTLSPQDADVLRLSAESAKQRAPQLVPAIDFLHSMLNLSAELPSERQRAARDFILKFQQLSGPVAAKGIEDTAFYNYHRLLSLNEVGGDPNEFGISIEEFHQRNLRRLEHWPHSLLASATHDTKRGEDTRARINVLSEIPEEWRAAVFHWRELNTQHKTEVSGAPAPDANDEYLFYQTLIGAWDKRAAPQDMRSRIAQFMTKATKEAKRHTSWTDPNDAYESATQTFVERVLEESNRVFLDSFADFQRKTTVFGAFNALSQTLLKLTSPGVPDIYQGCELWDYSLVDPDNRRPVNFALRRELLARVEPSQAAQEFCPDTHGALKLLVIHRTLQFRNAHRALFDAGEYIPLKCSSEHVCAFSRRLGDEVCIVVVPRLLCTWMKGQERPPLGDVWRDLEVPLNDGGEYFQADQWRNCFTNEMIRAENGALALRQVFATFPVALLAPI
ncbi:MAG TPA: malto-oligosyltrehalose synthase, partial [Candidatus Acidoferrum sp.]|nr:malto-oligosyltrehalose synthase [Candidatus Acidoferrum sp.]